eukprot:SAG11_NODE_15866_length_564_cov_0.776344_1_plen_31_part_10
MLGDEGVAELAASGALIAAINIERGEVLLAG